MAAAFWSTVSNASPSYQDENLFSDNLSLNVALGWLAGRANEYVYGEDGRKLSQLDWEIKNTPIIKGSISWDVSAWLTFEANGWMTLGPRNSTMNDFDWENPKQTHWTRWSYSPKTPLNYANEFNINSYIWLLKNNSFKVAGVIGYQQAQFHWTTIGGYYDYRRQCINEGGNNCQAAEGNFPLTPGIDYKQEFSVPYIGSKIQYKYNNWEFNTLLKYSPWVLAKDHDEHYRRQLSFREKTHNSEYYSVSANIAYYMTPQLKFFSEGIWNKYTQGRGAAQMTNNENRSSLYLGGDVAGIENKSYQITLGIAYQF
nr:omptin family outer membrane protease [Candidatus Rickettsiella viridis]